MNQARLKIHLLQASAGGFTQPMRLVPGMYRPHLRPVGSAQMLGVVVVAGPNELQPGETVTIDVAFVYEPAVSYAALKPGTSIQLVEGNRVIGEGIVAMRLAPEQ